MREHLSKPLAAAHNELSASRMFKARAASSGRRPVNGSVAQAQTNSDSPDALAPDATAIAYLDNLAECLPDNQTQPFPFPFMEGVVGRSVIQGWEDGACVVDSYVFLDTNPDQQVTMTMCRYSPATLELLTDDIAYEQARTGQASFSTDDERDMALSGALETECDFNLEWFEELTGS